MAEIDPSDRIVITGTGGLSPVGWEGILSEESGITDIRETVAARYKGFSDIGVRVAAGIKEDIDNDPLVREHRKSVKFMHRSALIAWVAMNRALENAKFENEQMDPYRIGFYVGSTFSGTDHFKEVKLSRVRIYDAFQSLLARVATAGAMEEGLKGKGGQVGAECASSGLALHIGAADLLRHQFRGETQESESDMVVIAGADVPITPNNVRVFNGSLPGAVDMRADPNSVSRPFDQDAQGLAMGEASWALIMETWKNAQDRGLKEEDVIAELVGFASFTDAKSRTLGGTEGMVRGMVKALKMAKVTVSETIYGNAHATSTPEGDPIEARATKLAIEELEIPLENLYVSSTKGATGHTMGTAGILEANFTARSVNEDVIPPNLKLENPISDSEGLQIPAKTLHRKVDVAFSNSFGFGGPGTTLVFRKFKA